ncbi:MAG: hypothetical protein AB7G54_00350 [Methyloceanibacter sp.]
MPIPRNEDKTMKARISLTGLSVAIVLFVTLVAMHEAARADLLSGQAASAVAAKHG